MSQRFYSIKFSPEVHSIDPLFCVKPVVRSFKKRVWNRLPGKRTQRLKLAYYLLRLWIFYCPSQITTLWLRFRFLSFLVEMIVLWYFICTIFLDHHNWMFIFCLFIFYDEFPQERLRVQWHIFLLSQWVLNFVIILHGIHKLKVLFKFKGIFQWTSMSIGGRGRGLTLDLSIGWMMNQFRWGMFEDN